MDLAAPVLVFFPAFLIGAAFGILLVMVLSGTGGLNTMRPIVFSIVGSLIGVVVSALTEAWWPPIIGPFVVCPAIAAAFALIGRRKS